MLVVDVVWRWPAVDISWDDDLAGAWNQLVSNLNSHKYTETETLTWLSASIEPKGIDISCSYSPPW